MMSKSKTIMMALLLAFRALGAPISTDSQSQVRSVIDALKAQMGAFNMLAGPSLIDGLEASLRLNGSLGAEHLAALDEKIQALTAGAEFDSNSIATATIQYLDANGAFDQTSRKEVEDKALSLTTDMINEVLAQGSTDCPHPGRICGGCTIL